MPCRVVIVDGAQQRSVQQNVVRPTTGKHLRHSFRILVEQRTQFPLGLIVRCLTALYYHHFASLTPAGPILYSALKLQTYTETLDLFCAFCKLHLNKYEMPCCVAHVARVGALWVIHF